MFAVLAKGEFQLINMVEKKTKPQKASTRYLMLIFPPVMVFISFLMFNSLLNPIQRVGFTPTDGPLNNPLMGLSPWANATNIHQPHSLVYADLIWREFEPQPGVYDFQAFEEKNHLAKWRERGVRVVFRFVMDVPKDEAHLDIPDWLYEATGGNGDHYDNDYGKGYSPNYNHPILIDAHQKALQALGDRYGGDDFIAYIELGSLGHWGEWHVYLDENIQRLPDEETRNEYVSHYLVAFPSTHLLMRRPFTIANEEALGLYNDMTGDPNATKRWLDWIDSGGEYSQTGEKDALSAMPDGWQSAPIGGEQTVFLSEETLYQDELDRTLDLLRASHTTFIGPGGPFDILPDNPLQTGVNKVLSKIGYRYYVSELRMPESTFFGHSIEGSATIKNIGIAPIYYPWPVWFYLMDATGEIQAWTSKGESMLGVLPEGTRTFEFTLPIDRLENGDYSVGIGIVDPITGEPAIRFAMDNVRSDRIQVLREVNVYSFFNYLSTFFWGR